MDDNKTTNEETSAASASQAPSSSAKDLHVLFDQIAEKIIEQQEAIIGPVAVEQAKLVKELKIDWPQHDVDVEGNPQTAIDDLVEQYKELFGQIAVQVSKEAVASLLAQLPTDQQPKTLQ